VLNRLVAKTRSSIVSAIAMSISTTATFEFHVKSWVGAAGDQATLPELLRLPHGSMLCIYGKEDQDAICPRLDASGFHIIELPGDHHFDGDYERLSSIVLDSIAHQ
jgi:type IV secretory pathway VirJ component